MRDEDDEPTLVSTRKDDFRDLVECAADGHVFTNTEDGAIAQRDPKLGALYTTLLATRDAIVAHCKTMAERPEPK